MGETAIEPSTLNRWMAALAPGHEVPVPPDYRSCIDRERSLGLMLSTETLRSECGQEYRKLKVKALDLLISSYWLIGAAAELHVKTPRDAVRVRARDVSVLTGLQGADAELRATAELSASEVRDELGKRVRRVTKSLAAKFYRQHIRSFERQELRTVELAENFPTAAAALKAKTEVDMGRSLADISLHEVLERFNTKGRSQNRRAAEEAIFAAKAHVLSGPVLLNKGWTIFEVTHITPPRREAFSKAEAKIRGQLAGIERRAVTTGFVRSWGIRWKKRTSCAPGYVIDRCSEYPRPSSDDEAFEFN